MSTIVVLKFGGTSLATPQVRALAVSRVREECDRGHAVVAVASAMGRAPDPYATDTLLSLIGGRGGTRTSDALLACGEIVSACVFADALEQAGLHALSLTGAQAGIVNRGNHGDAQILRVEPARVRQAIDEGSIPVIAGFQGLSESGDVTTLGRGGTDLTAIAIGHALEAERVDIYTDVDGAMTADPQRISGAHTIARASWKR